MAVYAYTAMGDAGSDGAVVRGTITADSPRSARDELRARGLSVQEVAEKRAARGGGGVLCRYLTGRHAVHVTGFLQELATLLGAGIPLLQALDTITRQHKGRFRDSIMLLRERVASGGGLAEAMRDQSLLFDELCVSIVDVGENAGTLDESLARLVEFRRRTAGLKNRVATAMMYPCIVAGAGVVVSVFLMTFVVPKLLGVLLDSGKPLPFATVIVKAISDALVGWWWLILLVVGGVVGAVIAVLRTDGGRMKWHRFQLRVPLIGELIRKQTIARMSMVMATLLKSDLVFAKAIRIAQRSVHNRVLRDALVACERAVEAGRDISVALESTDAFPPLVVQVFAVGQASGRLEVMLENLSSDYDAQVEIASGRLTALLEPILMMVLAVGVGFIVFATILPILEAGNVL